MMKFTPETSQSDSNSSNANFSVSLAVMPIVRTILKRSVTNCFKLSHLQKSSPGFKRFNSSAPALTNVELEIGKNIATINNKNLLDLLDSADVDRAEIDNKKKYTRLVDLLHGKQYCAEIVKNRVSDADFEAEIAVITANRKEYANMTAALSQARNLDITKCLRKSLNYYFPTEAELGRYKAEQACNDLQTYSMRKVWNVRNTIDQTDDFKNLNREKDLKDLVAEINDMKAPNNMLVNADAIDNFKKLDYADAIDDLNFRLMCLMRQDKFLAERVIRRLSDADWEAKYADTLARTKEVFNQTVDLSLRENVDISKCLWKSLNDDFPTEAEGINEHDFNDIVADIFKNSA